MRCVCIMQMSLFYRSLNLETTMSFIRSWDSCCPRVWDSWQEGGFNWVIRDLRPEDDEDALKILLEEMCRDELLLKISDILNDPVSMRSIEECWRISLKQRMSLGCFQEKDGKSKLVALNVCLVSCRGHEFHLDVKGKAWKNVYDAMEVAEKKIDCFKLLDVDKFLHGLGLIVHKNYRGKKLGSKLLAAREPLCLHHCIRASVTIFSGPASQKSAERVGFTTADTLTLKQLAGLGLEYPEDDSKCIKLMVIKYKSKISSTDS